MLVLGMEWIFLYLGVLVLWAGTFIGIACWVVKRVIPSLLKEMEEQGLNDIQKQLILTKAVFPPKFPRN